jgi:hypothetical protein
MQIAKGQYPTDDVDTAYGKFTIKYPSGEDDMRIERKISDCLGGRPVSSFSDVMVISARRDMTLSVVISSYPDKFPKQFQGDAIVNFPDQEVKYALYKAYNTFYSRVQEEIQGKLSGK